MTDPIVFTAETNILKAMLCRVCKGERPAVKGATCAHCGGTGGDPRVIEVFRNFGMRCWKKGEQDPCVATEVETLNEAALYHDMELSKLLDALNALKLSAP